MFGNILKFIGKYGQEATLLSGVLRNLLPAIPIGRKDREKVEGVLEHFEGIEGRLSEFLETVQDDIQETKPVVKISQADISKAVAAHVKTAAFKKAVATAVKAEIAKAKK